MRSRPLVFISHSSVDSSLAVGLCNALESRGILTWIASRDVSVGSDHAHESFLAISRCDGLAVLLTKDAYSSGFVRREVEFAISLNTLVFPIEPSILDATMPYPWNLLLTSLQILETTSMDDAGAHIALRLQ